MPTPLLTMPLTAYVPGRYGPFVSPAMPEGSNAYRCDYSKGASWPDSGDALTYTVEISEDGGATWRFDLAITLTGGKWFKRDGVTETSDGSAGVTMPAANAMTLIRGTLTVHQACEVGGVLESLS